MAAFSGARVPPLPAMSCPSAIGRNCPALLSWVPGNGAARARRYAFWASMNGAVLKRVVIDRHRAGGENNLAIGSAKAEWTTRRIDVRVGDLPTPVKDCWPKVTVHGCGAELVEPGWAVPHRGIYAKVPLASLFGTRRAQGLNTFTASRKPLASPDSGPLRYHRCHGARSVPML